MLRRRPSNASEKEQAQKKKVSLISEVSGCSGRLKTTVFSAQRPGSSIYGPW